MSNEQVKNLAQNLVAQDVPLNGIHLIEASAGTGKTHNITRIYLRLLLENRLTVQQILVMTFTKDATEEIRGRIDSFIRQALNQWQHLKENDAFFQSIATQIDDDQAKLLLKQALLFLDEAAIYTIHGFCKTVLTQHAFESGVSFNANMESDQQSLVLQATQDWYRQLASENEQAFLQVVQFWPVPHSLLSHFSKAIYKDCPLTLTSSSSLIEQFNKQLTLAIDDLSTHKTFLFSHLVDGKKPAEQEKRTFEFEQTLAWLKKTIDDHHNVEDKMPDGFFDGRRFGKSKVKIELVEIFASVNNVKKKAQTLLTDLAKLKALAVVKQGIYKIRAQVKRDKQQINLLSFDDLISTLANHLTSEQGASLAQSLAKQYPFALIDEFQDTDPAQFAILKRIYYHRQQGGLMMIGDPKQAIYGFRGGDVFAYMTARADCDHQWLMDTNWRSTCQMVNGYNRLFYGNELNKDANDIFGYNIAYHPVKPSPNAIKAAQLHNKNEAALRFVHFMPQDEAFHRKDVVKQTYRSEMAIWCANEIIHLLSSPSHHDETQSIEAKDIALLVRDSAEAMEVKQALFNAGLPSVYLSNRANLLHSEQTRQLIQILKGILFLENERLFSASLVSPLLPYSAAAFYQLQNDDLAWQEIKVLFSQLREEWLQKGFITMALKLMHDHMVITGDDSERCLTNLLHLFELLQTASQRHKQPQELLYWFEQQSLAENSDLESELRLESEENLIRIITQHGSKGLEYPVVFVPFATRHKNPLKFGTRSLQLIEYHNQEGELTLSLSASPEAKQAMADEAYAETIRLLYVAVTRAEQRCYLLSTNFEQSFLSPLGLTCQWQQSTDITANLTQLVHDNPDDISLTLISDTVPVHSYSMDSPLIESAKVSQFNGNIERDWWLSSFTALSRNIRDNGVSTPDRDSGNHNEQRFDEQENNHAHLIRFALTKGANTGNLLHDIFEHLNFVHPDWQQTLKWPLLKYGELGQGFSQNDLEKWLQQIINTPLTQYKQDDPDGCDNFSLSAISHEHSLREVEFYFPLEQANTQKLSNLLLEHRNNSLYRTKQHSNLSLSFHRYLKGMMHGFIDLIIEHQGKYYICDYKSNHLGDDYSHYKPEFLQANIEQHHYDLQYLIYSLALHRYLKITLANYDVERDFGGVYYLYLRGMSNNEQHAGCGIYYRDISQIELQQLDDIFAGEASSSNKQTFSGEQVL